MSQLTKGMRHSRFRFKQDALVQLVIETKVGTTLTLKAVDASLNGIRAVLDSVLSETEVVTKDDIVPSAKIKIPQGEIFLGRLVVRRQDVLEGKTIMAFSTLDQKFPIDGSLARYLDGTLDEKKDPYRLELSPNKFNVGSFENQDLSHPDLFHRTEQFQIYFNDWTEAAKYGHNNIRLPSAGTRVKLKRLRKGDRNDYLVMGSNDYLGLAARPEVKEAAKKAIDQYGFGSTGSPLTTGLTEIHEQLCDELARMFKKEKVLLYNSGYSANIGTITGMMRESDLILADFLAHASIQDGMQMSKATWRLFKHNDLAHLEKLLREHRQQHAGSLVITEGVFSMDGDSPPLAKIIELARKYDSRVMVDEAHSWGVVGPNGLGIWETCPRENVDIIMGTFSKICGGIGGFIAADESVVSWLTWHARSQIFSVSIPPSTAAAALAGLRVFKQEPELFQSLRRNIKHFVSGLRDLGCPLPLEHPSAVIPVVIGNEEKLGIMHEVLRDSGIYVIPVIYPAVSRKNCRFRFTVMATHTESDLDHALTVLERAMEKAEFRFSESEGKTSKVA